MRIYIYKSFYFQCSYHNPQNAKIRSGEQTAVMYVPVYPPLSVIQLLVVCAMRGGEARTAIRTSTSVKKTRMYVTTQ